MPIKQEPLRYAHDEGHTDVCFSSDGRNFITCGLDGDIRIWPVDESEDPIHNCVGEWASSIKYCEDNLYVATGSNDIQILTFPDGERNGVLDRFTAPINQIAISGKLIALAGEDMKVRLINLEKQNEEQKDVTVFEDLKGPCLSVAISPTLDFLASSSGDSTLRVWNIAGKELVKEIPCFPKVNSFANAKTLCRLDFEPVTGRFLAYPDKDTVVLLNTSDWSQSATLSANDIEGDFSIVQFSPCGKFVAATTTSGDFVIWDVDKESIQGQTKHEKSLAITGFAWNPSETNKIVYTDIEGQLGILSECVPQKKSISEPIPDSTEYDVDFDDVQFNSGDENIDVSDDDDGENVISIEKLKRQFADDDDNKIDSELNFGSGRSPTPRPGLSETPMQPPVMPSSTPEHLNPRYLCWNEVGIIRSYGSFEDEESSKSIEVEFHDSSFHNGIMIQNYQDYFIGSVSKSALVVANSSQINVIPLALSSKEWLLKVEETEDIVLVASSENLICFGTSNYLVKIVSIYGTQRGVLSLPGPLVSMSAHKNSVLIAYHHGGTRKNDQIIGIKLVEVEGFSLKCKEIGCALGPESLLMWLGFSDVGTPALIDSLGMFCMYPISCDTWIPFCDTSKHRKSQSDGFFVTAVFESCQTMAGIKCKGTVFPSFTPRPTLCELPLEPPFAESSTEKSQLEMGLFAYSNLKMGSADRKIKETGLKSFALACRNNLDQRALEFMEILSNPQLLQLGIKYSMKLDKRRLAEKLTEMAAKLVQDADEDDYSSSFTLEKSSINGNSSMNNKPKKLSLGTVGKSVPSLKKVMRKEVEIPVKDNKPVDESQNSEILFEDSCDDSYAFSETVEEPKNPFLKNLKPVEIRPANPLSLTNKSAGVDFNLDQSKENKRKIPESEVEKHQQPKQRKLDKFMFSKRN